MQAVIKHWSMQAKLLLLLMLPLLFLLFFAGRFLLEQYQQLEVAATVQQKVTLTLSLGELITGLQTERGSSGVFLGSKGARFADKMQQAREQSDQAMMALQQLPETATLLTASLRDLSQLRLQIDQQALKSTDSAAKYTEIITALLRISHQSEQELQHRQMAQQLALLNQWMEMIERAGRERALLGLAFNQNQFDLTLLSKITGNIGAFGSFAENVQRQVLPSQQWLLQGMSQVDSAEFKRQQQLVFSAGVGTALNVDSATWFELATHRINQLVSLQTRLLQELQQQAALVHQQANQGLWLAAGLVLLLLLVLGWLSWQVIHNIQQAVTDINQAILALAGRDLTARVQYQSRDEFGQIASGVNQLAVELQQVLQQIDGATAQVATAAEQASAVTLQTSRGVAQQQQDTEMAATAMHEMSTTVRDVASSTAEAAEQASTVQQHAGRGLQELQQSISLIAELTGQVQATNGTIVQVKTHSQSINTVLEVIRGIAEQTNLLALNAAIEAARAGEQGRGFAVVADEVRHLAQRTQQSTVDIRQMIETLQQSTEQASADMQHSVEQAEQGMQSINATGQLLHAVLSGIDAIHDKTTQIASAAEEQSTVAEQINQNIIRISDVSTQTSAGAEQTAVTARELARLAASLQGMVARFRLG